MYWQPVASIYRKIYGILLLCTLKGKKGRQFFHFRVHFTTVLYFFCYSTGSLSIKPLKWTLWSVGVSDEHIFPHWAHIGRCTLRKTVSQTNSVLQEIVTNPISTRGEYLNEIMLYYMIHVYQMMMMIMLMMMKVEGLTRLQSVCPFWSSAKQANDPFVPV